MFPFCHSEAEGYVAEFVPQIIKTGLDKLFEVTREKDQTSLITVLIALQTRGALSAEQLLAGIRKSTDQLEDLRLASVILALSSKCICHTL